MNPDRLKELHIDDRGRKPGRPSLWIILLVVLLISAAVLYFAWPRLSQERRVVDTRGKQSATSAASGITKGTNAPGTARALGASPSNAVLTVSGYIINRERIELSPRFMGVVKWIGVKKGDAVTNGQVVVLLDDAEYVARVREADGRLEGARVAVDRADIDNQRVQQLGARNFETKQAQDDARLRLAAARASLHEVEGQNLLARTYLDWTVIRSPINGVVLEKLVDPNELVVPQSFGGTRGPSTALIALADPKDLQVEIDLNEADLAKVSLNQTCRVTPEAFPDHSYRGVVAEIAPEASRQKGTLQIKVQIQNPDRFLIPELSARVDFLGR